MRSAIVCLGIAAVLVVGCGKDDYEAKRPKYPTPKCEAVGEDAAKAFARFVSAQDRAGDLPVVVQQFHAHRKAIEAAIAKRDPALAQRLKPVLDKYFADDALRARAACGFAPLAGGGGGLAALDEWSRSPEMRAINQSIWNRKPAPSEEDNAEMTPRRKTLLRDIGTAMALQQIQANMDVVASGEAANLIAALDAPVSQVGAPAAKRVVSIEEVVERWLTPALIKISEDDLAAFLNFVESPFGADYYVALTAAYDFRNGDWYAKLYEQLREASAPGDLPAGNPGKDAVIAEARNLLRNIATPAAAVDATHRLLQVERVDPRNPEIHLLLAEAAIKSTTMPLGPDQLRVVIESPNYEQADKHIAKALELAPIDPNAHMWLGRLRYLQGRDDEAMQAYQRAGEIDPMHPSLDLNLGDLFFEAPDYSKAARYYLAVLAKPESQPYQHYITMAHLQIALRKGNRIADYPRHADAYLAKYPDAWNIRLDYADYLMSTNIKADKIIAVAEPVPDAWQPARKYGVLSAALVRKASERVEKKTGEPIGEGMAAMRRAISLNPDPRTLAEAVCRSGVDAKIAVFVRDASKNVPAVASAMVVCALRWRRADIIRVVTPSAQSTVLSQPQQDLMGDTPMCYAAALKDVKAFSALAKLQVNPVVKCNDGNPVAERLSRMAYGGDRAIPQMQGIMSRFYRKQ
ncbi:tetratricopeptide repeat protein [Lysobacter hankyongensis]|uniref:Tetratricopeptide repeat protein n=1 Tax=Lysobacter hankyongensis TaxID=1176535 RepID=A0ABP9BJH6_9GAMM